MFFESGRQVDIQFPAVISPWYGVGEFRVKMVEGRLRKLQIEKTCSVVPAG
jgi:hypothetical protein